MVHLLSSLLSSLQNQFVTGGLLLMITGAVMALARRIPSNVLRWVERCVTSSVEIRNNDPLFDYITYWLDAQPYTKKSRRLTARTKMELRGVGDDGDVCNTDVEVDGSKQIRVFFSPAPGNHFFFYDRRLLQLSRVRADKSSGSSDGHTITQLREPESYHLTTFGYKTQAMRNLVRDIVAYGSNPRDGIRLFYSTYGFWQSMGRTLLRPLKTVILPDGVAEGIVADARWFLANKEWYQDIGIPWHRGYLLYGLPGTGKSSLVAALAGELHMDLYVLNVSGSGMTDDRLCSLMSEVRPGCIILMEDADCTVPARAAENEARRESSSKVTLSGLLNCLDGVSAREGCILFMTTNFVERLDDALIRPGRIDYRLEFGYATESQKQRLAAKTGGVAPEGEGWTMAEVQQELMQQMKDHRSDNEKQATLLTEMPYKTGTMGEQIRYHTRAAGEGK